MRRVVFCLVLVVGCRQVFGIHDPGGADAGIYDSQPEIDAMVCTDASASCAGPSMLRTCAGPGAQPTEERCDWGCLAGDTLTAPHCGELQPQGGAVTPTDLQDMSSLTDVSLASGSINATTGEIIVGATSLRAPGLGVISGIDFEVRGKVAVFRMSSVVLGSVTVEGAYAVAIVANRDITVTGDLDAEGACTDRGGGPGGANGGISRGNGLGSGGGEGANANTDGGGGGGYGAAGGIGGTELAGGTNGGVAYGDATIMALVGGSGGGAGGANSPALSARGGGGGGGLQLVSNANVIVTGAINAGGCGGDAGAAGPGGGGGGGAGGTILLEAPNITVIGAVAANGGGGGGGGANSQPGGSGTADVVAALGGASNHGDGGSGGNGAHPAGNVGANNAYPGGGGGAAGRLRFETLGGSVNGFGATSPMPSIAAANVQ